jgi:hypothetical protein
MFLNHESVGYLYVHLLSLEKFTFGLVQKWYSLTLS